jgi:hypothetical protein
LDHCTLTLEDAPTKQAGVNMSKYDGVWDGKKVKFQAGDLSEWEFVDVFPWMTSEEGKLFVVVPDSNLIDGEWERVEAGVDLDDLIDWFLHVLRGGDHEYISEKKSAIKALERAIEKIKATL